MSRCKLAVGLPLAALSVALVPFAGLAVAPVLAPGIVLAQEEEERPPAMVRFSYYQLDFSEMERWNQLFEEEVTPVLDAMQEEGAIQGYSAWTHDTGGGDYNWLMGIRFYEGANITAVTEDFVSRLGEAAPEAMGQVQRMIWKHEDQIWEVVDAWFTGEGPPPPTARHYAADFLINPADLEAWNGHYRETWRPALERAGADGILAGFVVLEHLHGGPYNWKIIYFAPEWDSLDDVWNTVFDAFGEDEAAWQEALGMIRGHTDAIWAPASPPEAMEEEGS